MLSITGGKGLEGCQGKALKKQWNDYLASRGGKAELLQQCVKTWKLQTLVKFVGLFYTFGLLSVLGYWPIFSALQIRSASKCYIVPSGTLSRAKYKINKLV